MDEPKVEKTVDEENEIDTAFRKLILWSCQTSQNSEENEVYHTKLENFHK